MAVHLTRDCPGKSFAILDRRDCVGGTWDLFRYPGIRSDSDMHTLGFSFSAVEREKSIADGPSILEYDNITDEYGLREKMRFRWKRRPIGTATRPRAGPQIRQRGAARPGPGAVPVPGFGLYELQRSL